MLITRSRLHIAALRRFPEAHAIADRILALEPTNGTALDLKARAFWELGDLEAVEPLLANPGTEPFIRGFQALFKRHYDAAVEIFSKALAGAPVEDSIGLLLYLGLTQQRAGEVAAARATYQQAVQEVQRQLKKVTLDSPHEAGLHAGLGWAYAGLGEAASAVAEGQKAMVMRPTSKDPFEGPALEENMAEIYALLGDAEHAIPILKRLLQIPYGICDYSGVAAARSDLGSNPQRSSLSGIGRRKETVNLRNFFAQLSGVNVYKVAVAYAGTSCLSYHSFSVFLVQDQRPTESRKQCYVLYHPLCHPGIKNGQLLMTWDDEASSASYQQKVVCVVETTADEV